MQYAKVDDNHFTVTATVEVSDQFWGWLLGFGKRAKLLSPDDTVEQFTEYLDIMTHGEPETIKKNLHDFHEMRLISECHGKAFRYMDYAGLYIAGVYTSGNKYLQGSRCFVDYRLFSKEEIENAQSKYAQKYDDI